MGYPVGSGSGQGQSPIPQDWTQGPKPRTVSVKAATTSQELFTGVGHVVSFNYAETTGAAKVLAYLHDGVDNTGQIIGCLATAASGSGGADPGIPGFYFTIGLYLEVISGSLSLAVSFTAGVDQEPN